MLPNSSNSNLISAAKNPSLITLSNKNNSVEFLKNLANKIRSSSLIDFVKICKSSTENLLEINDFRDIFVFNSFICNLLLPNNTIGSLVLMLRVKLYGFNKNLTSINSKFIFLLIFEILFIILSLNLSVFTPTKLK